MLLSRLRSVPAPHELERVIAALRQRDFRLLFVGLVVSMVGDSTLLLVPGILMKDLTGSAGAAGLTVLFFMLPICAAPAFGWLIDRIDRRTVLISACVLSSAALLPLLAVDDRSDWWIVYAVSAAMGASYVCVFGAVTALVKDLLPVELLAEANGVIQAVRQGLRIGGPLLGAALYATFGIGAVALLDMATFAVSAAIFTLLPEREPGEPDAAPPDRPGRPGPWSAFLTEVTAGARVIVRDAAVRRSVIAIGVLFLAGGVAESAIFAIVSDGLHRPPAFVGVLATMTGIGAVFGGLLAAALIRSSGELAAIGAGIAVYGLATIAMAVPALSAVLGASVAIGVGMTVPVVGRVTLLQRSTPSRLLGRAATAYDAIGGVCQVVSIAAGAALVTVVSYRLLLPALGVLALAAAGYAFRGAALARTGPAAKE
jgi:MFS family permease